MDPSPRPTVRVRNVTGALIGAMVVSFAAARAGATEASALERAASGLMHRWAPTFLQHASIEERHRDVPVRVDFDGDWDATNNWDNFERQPLHEAAAYGAAILTRTHAF